MTTVAVAPTVMFSLRSKLEEVFLKSLGAIVFKHLSNPVLIDVDETGTFAACTVQVPHARCIPWSFVNVTDPIRVAQ